MGYSTRTAGWLVRFCLVLLAICSLPDQVAEAQALTGTLFGTVKDEQGGVLAGAVVRVTSRELIGGVRQTTTNDRG